MAAPSLMCMQTVTLPPKAPKTNPVFPEEDGVARAPARLRLYAAFLSSKNCSSSVEPFKAAVEALASMVVVTESK